ncbi:MAG: hypothetical protein NTY38_12280, partial [Acidobacteria bacterium]|nr:hypothetical protein [Acidobacteriota bacterium]
ETTGRTIAELPRRIGHQRQLFVDDWMIEQTGNLRREPGRPVKHPGNPVLRRSRPWDAARCDLYGNAVFDPEARVLQMFYNNQSWPRPAAGQEKPRKVVELGYAESRDGGVNWEKPEFGFVPFDGHTRTNVVYRPRHENLAGPSVFRDQHDADPARRYKLFTSDYGEAVGEPSAAPPGIDVAFSPDGMRWRRSSLNPVLPLLSDTAHSAMWDQRIGRYVAFVRLRPKGFGRAVGRTESLDFEHWSPPELIFTTRPFQFYAMGVTPYEGMYIGTPWMIYNDRKDPSIPPPIMEPELATSRDGWNWARAFPGTPFVPVGRRGDRDEKQVRLASSLVVLEDRILCFYGMSPHGHVSGMEVDIGLATLRLDGFAAMVAGEVEGRLLTRPFVWDGSRLLLNLEAGQGRIAVAVLDAKGRKLPGLQGQARGDGLHVPVTWAAGANAARLQGRTVRLELTLHRARLYSFQVAP